MSKTRKHSREVFSCDFGIVGTREVQSRDFGTEREAVQFAERWRASSVAGCRWAELTADHACSVATRSIRRELSR